jgi:serine/threonine-protein kinase
MRRSMAEHEANYGRSVENLLGDALGDARRAIDSAPSRPQARMEVARIYRQWGEIRQNHGDDPADQLQNAIGSAEAIALEDQDALYFSNLGLVFTIWADYDDQVGATSEGHRGQAIDAYAHALKIADQLSSARINLGINYFMRASSTLAVAPDGDLQLALEALTRAQSDNARHVVPYVYIGRIRALMSERARARGEDPVTLWAQALEAYDQGLVINQNLPQLHNGKGIALMAQAQDAWDRGRSAEPLLDRALDAFDRAIEIAPEQGFGYASAGVALIQRARWQLARGQDPRTSIRAAQLKLRQALHGSVRCRRTVRHAWRCPIGPW